MTLEATLEAILIARSEPQSIKELARICSSSVDQVREAIQSLETTYREGGRGMRLVVENETVALSTAPELASLLNSLKKSDQEKELGNAGLETLALVLYEAPIARSTIDRIRGVNSSYTLRMLLTRGLIQRVADRKDARHYVYTPTVELLSFLGLPNIEALQDRDKVRSELMQYLQATAAVEAEATPATNE